MARNTVDYVLTTARGVEYRIRNTSRHGVYTDLVLVRDPEGNTVEVPVAQPLKEGWTLWQPEPEPESRAA